MLPSNIATISNIDVIDATSNNTITIIVSGEGDYEFAIDNISGPYQDSNLFENVSPGLHDVYIRDNNNCGIVQELVSVIGFPKFLHQTTMAITIPGKSMVLMSALNKKASFMSLIALVNW